MVKRYWRIPFGVVIACILAWQVGTSHHPIPLTLLAVVIVAAGLLGYWLRRRR